MAPERAAADRFAQSHYCGPGPEMRRVLFNTGGHCPLISHYLVMAQLRENYQPGKRVMRTEIAKPTYPWLRERLFVVALMVLCADCTSRSLCMVLLARARFTYCELPVASQSGERARHRSPVGKQLLASRWLRDRSSLTDPSPALPTYRQIIQSKQEMSNDLRTQYQK